MREVWSDATVCRRICCAGRELDLASAFGRSFEGYMSLDAPQLRTSREGGADDVVEGTMSALHSRDSFAARACVWRARSLARVGRQFASTKAVVRCGFDPCGACTVDFDDGIFLLARDVSGDVIKAARGLLSFSPAEASHPRIPPVLRPRRRGGHPLRRTVGCRRFRTTGRHDDDRGKVAHEMSHARDCASSRC